MRTARQAVAWIAVVVLVGSLTAAAVFADGREGIESTTNDGGAWLLNRSEGVVGHVNRVVGEVDNIAGPFSGSFDLTQAPGIVVVNDRAAGQAVLIDTKLSAPGARLGLPAPTALSAFPDGVVAYTHTTGRLWRISRDDFGTIHTLDDVAPDVELASPGVFAVGLDGRIIAVDGGGQTAHIATPDGEWTSVALGDLESSRPAIAVTLVGSRSVVLHESGTLSVIDSDGAVSQFNVTSAASLQQPSDDMATVAVVHDDGTITTVDLASGDEATTASTSATGIRPIVHAGCIWSITTNPAVFRYCGREFPLNASGGELRLMLVNGWVWVNDVDTGGVWFVSDDDLKVSELGDWSVAMLRDDQVDDESPQSGDDENLVIDTNADDLVDDVAALDDDGVNEPPIALDDVAATRRGRPVVVKVLSNDTDPDHDPLAVSALREVDADGFTTDGARVTINADGSAIQVVPNVDFVGTINFGYEISDGRGGADSATVSVEVNRPDADDNRPPVTVIDNGTVRAGESVSVNVLRNDSDPDGDVLVLTGVGDVDGAVGFTPDGEVQFTPDIASPYGTVEISYTVADDFGLESVGTLRVRVRPAGSNQPPQARNDIAQAAVGHTITLNVLTNDYDPDGDPLIAQNLQTADGSSTTATLGPDGQFLFRPEQPGSYRFTYTVSDGPTVDVAQIRVTATAEAANRPAVTVVDEVALAVGETRLVRVLDNDGDPDGDVIGLVDWVGADGLTITEVPNVGFYVTPTPAAGPRTMFRYWISDGKSEPTMGTVIVSAINREPVDYPPVAVVDTIDARAGTTTAVNVLRNDHDPEGGALEIAGPVATPTEALVRVSADKQQLLLTVNAEQQYGFTFSYDVVDPAGNRGSALVHVRVVPRTQTNRAPIASPDVATTPFETPVKINVLSNDKDPDGDPIAVESISEQPAHGDVELLPNGVIQYTPRAGFSGTDRFVYTLVDGYQAPVGDTDDGGDGGVQPISGSGAERSRGEVLIGVMAPAHANRPPIAVDDDGFASVGVASDPVELSVLTNDSDPDGDVLMISGVTDPPVGSVQVAASRTELIYTPPADGRPQVVTFSYTVADGRGGSATAKVLLNLVDVATAVPPVAVDDSLGPLTAGSVVTFDPRLNDRDSDGDSSLLTVVTADPALSVRPDGTVDLTVPATNQEFEYQVQDSQGLLSEPARIKVLVTPNAAPTITPINVETPFNTAVEIDLAAAANDIDQDRLVISLGSQRNGGAVRTVDQASGLVVRFEPDTDFEGQGSFDFTVDDLNGHTVTGTAVVTVLPPENREPVAVDYSITAEAGLDAVVRLPNLVTDPDGPAEHRYSVANASGPISLEGPGGNGVVIVSSALTAGGSTANFDYTVVDGPYTITKRVTVELVVAKYPAPSLATDSAQTLQGETTAPIQVLDNDVDNTPPGLTRALSITSVGVSTGGTATVENNAIVFAPAPDFFGVATFTYTVQDARRSAEGESSATVNVSVIGRPEVPLAPSVQSVGDGYAVVGWNPPAGDAARAPITGYVLRYTGADGTEKVITFDQPTTSHRIDGLTNGVQYCFAVAGVNAAGTGEFSQGGATSCGSPDIRPEPPAAPIVTFGDAQLSLVWSAPLNRGSAIKNYQLRISGGAQSLSAELGSVTSFTWTGLKNGTDYTFEVRAQNSAVDNGGWSDWSALSAPEHPLTVPAAPAPPAAQRGDRQVLVTWQAPDDGGDAILRYQIRSSLSPNWVDAPAQGQFNTYRWDNIANGTDVNFEVRAINRDPRSTNPGNISPPSPTVRTCAVPDPPGQPGVTRLDSAAEVTWSLPYDQGCAITEYLIIASNGATQTVSGDSTSHVFTGLTNGTPYTFNVAAINEVVFLDGRDVNFSGASNQVVPAGPPFATNVTSAANSGVKTVSLSWDPANDNGSPIIRYELSINGGPWFDVGNVTSLTRVENSDGATYTYTVRAVNDVGAASGGGQQTVTTWSKPGEPRVSASSDARGALTVSWVAPNDGGTPITEYQVMWWYSFEDCANARDQGVYNVGSPYSFTGLSDGTPYVGCVRYKNAVDWGPWGRSTAVYTPAAPPPSVGTGAGAMVKLR